MKAKTSTIQGLYTFSNESPPLLHHIFPNESNVNSTKATSASEQYFLAKCRKQSDFALEKCKCYHIICRHQYTYVTNSILFVVCPFKIGFHPNENQLYFISVFIYTCIKVKLTEGEKDMAAPKPNLIRPADFLFWLQKIRSPTQKKSKARLTHYQDTKSNPKIR